jgi:hypothetical protein
MPYIFAAVSFKDAVVIKLVDANAAAGMGNCVVGGKG